MIIIIPDQNVKHHASKKLRVVLVGIFPTASYKARQIQIRSKAAFGFMELQSCQAADHKSFFYAVFLIDAIKPFNQ